MEQPYTRWTPTASPLLRSAQVGLSYEIASLLLEHGASPDDVDEKKRTPLHLAVAEITSEDPRIARVLLRYGSKIDARDESDMTPLHHAATHGYHDTIMKALLEYGADVNAVTSLGQTALHLAALAQKHFWKTVVATLLQYGANPGLVDTQGRTVFGCISTLQLGELHRLVAAHSPVATT